ncbi:MAG TPA: efflux RND transporter periplasmic adaptor subunit [Alphaproteobacteria bacterium]|nr:efflux RND transporter periplasmic adaptor subunit [Alphaproteobacteria bacterium]
MFLSKVTSPVAGVAAAVLIAGCSAPKAAGPKGPPGFPVKVIVAQNQLVPDSTQYLATMWSRNSSILQPQVEGDVTKIFVRPGERVAAGAAILEIDPHRQEAAVNNQEATSRSKQATLQLASMELDRRKKLFAAGVIAKADLDQAEAAYGSAKADLEALEASTREQKVQLRYYTVRAPAAGVVGDIPMRVGDRVTTQTTLTTLNSSNTLEAYIEVPAEKSSLVKPGTAVEILNDDGAVLVRAKVWFVSPQVNPATQTLLLKAYVPNEAGRFRNEQQVHANVIWAERQAPLIPMTAVSRLSGKLFAFVAEGQGQQTVARQRTIRVGDVIGNSYVVLEGIKPGERVITSGVQILADGMPVIPQS